MNGSTDAAIFLNFKFNFLIYHFKKLRADVDGWLEEVNLRTSFWVVIAATFLNLFFIITIIPHFTRLYIQIFIRKPKIIFVIFFTLPVVTATRNCRHLHFRLIKNITDCISMTFMLLDVDSNFSCSLPFPGLAVA